MPTPGELNEKKREAQAKLLGHILADNNSDRILKVALAYRYLDGGDQPGAPSDRTEE